MFDDPTTYVARFDLNFGGVLIRRGEPVPVHISPYSLLLRYGGFYLTPVDPGTAPENTSPVLTNNNTEEPQQP